MELLQEVIVAARNIRAELKLDPKRRVPADLAPANARGARSCSRKIARSSCGLPRSPTCAFPTPSSSPAAGRCARRRSSTCASPTARRWNCGAELARLRKEKERLARDLESKQSRLADETFRSRAPAEIVRQLEATLAERTSEFDKLTERLAQLEKSATDRLRLASLAASFVAGLLAKRGFSQLSSVPLALIQELRSPSHYASTQSFWHHRPAEPRIGTWTPC